MLFNIGYKEALKFHDFKCFIFHDVDLIPENDKNYYGCPTAPRHLSVAVDKFGYRYVEIVRRVLFQHTRCLVTEHSLCERVS